MTARLEKLKQIENNSEIHLANMQLWLTPVWKHAYCKKMLETQNWKKRSKKGAQRGRFGRRAANTAMGWSQFRGLLFAQCGIRTLSHFEPGHGNWNCMESTQCGGQNHLRAKTVEYEALWSGGGGSFRYYLRPSSPIYLPPMRTLRRTLARGILFSKVQNGGDTGGWLLG